MNGEAERSAGWRDPKPVIDEMVRRITERFHPEQIILFGSHAKGTGRRGGLEGFQEAADVVVGAVEGGRGAR